MKITKIAGLTDEEKMNLVKAGQIISEFNKAFETGEIDTLSEELKNYLAALKDVLEKVLVR